MRQAIIISLTFLIMGCSSMTTNHYTQTVQSWRGGNANTLVKTWGKPDKIAQTRTGDIVYFYNTRSYSNNSRQTSPAIGVSVSREGRPILANNSPTNTWYRGSVTQTCTAAFVTNKQGKIIDTQTNGAGCFGSANFSKRLTNPG